MHREAAGLATLRATTPHMIFKGNPGTGKTVRAVHGRQASFVVPRVSRDGGSCAVR